VLPAGGKKFINKIVLLRSAGIPIAISDGEKKVKGRKRAAFRRLWGKFWDAVREKPVHEEHGDTEEKTATATFTAAAAAKLTTNTSTAKRLVTKDVLDLDYLLLDVMSRIQPLDWVTFSANERNQPLRMVS
jgi:hypothetical protein